MKKIFTDGFYKFLLGFSVILLLSIGSLFFLGIQGGDQSGPEHTDPESQLAQ